MAPNKKLKGAAAMSSIRATAARSSITAEAAQSSTTEETAGPSTTEAAGSSITNRGAKSTTIKKKDKRRKRAVQSYNIYILRVLRQVHPELRLSRKTLSIMNSFLIDIFERIASEAKNLIRYNKKPTLSSRVVQTVVRLLLPNQLGTYAMNEGTKAVAKFTAHARK